MNISLEHKWAETPFESAEEETEWNRRLRELQGNILHSNGVLDKWLYLTAQKIEATKSGLNANDGI